MCRGLALGYNTKTNKMICKGLSHHTKTLGDQEDDCVKLEIVVNDSVDLGFEVLLDEGYSQTEQKRFPKYIKKTMEPTAFFYKIIENYIDDNKCQIYKWLLNCQSYAKRKSYTDNSFQKTEGYTNNSFQKTEGYTNNSYQETEDNTYNTGQKTEGNTDNSYQETGKEWYMGQIYLMKYPNTTKLIRKIKYSWDLTIVEALSWCANNPERVKEIMGNEFIK